MIRALGFSKDSVEVILVHNPKIMALRLGILCVYLISLRVSLGDLCKQRFIVLAEVRLVLETALVRELVSL